MLDKELRKNRRKVRTKAKISAGTAKRPRLIVQRSNTTFYARIVDDNTGKTLLGIDTRMLKAKKTDNKTTRASELGKLLAEKASNLSIKEVVFDRSGLLYHGRVKAFCEAAREAGIKI